ncbi:MAG TPA: family 10 glycosylhydrolase, partial [Opitutales bacterium]|nr:family 10 glycosylhydrolase [Opitutales bacterium]
MPKKIALFLLLPLFLLCSIKLTAQTAPEIRGIWVDTWGSGFKTKAQIDQLIADAQRGNLNTIFPQVRRRGDAFYNSNIEPKNPQVSPGSFDPLAYLIERAHAANPRIEVHAWIIAYPLGSAHGHPDHILNKNPDWIMEAANGSKLISNEYWADPAHPGVQQHIVDVSLDLINNYDIDGLQFDYIRYPSPDWGYNPLSVARFNNRFGTSGKPAANNSAWRQFRRDAVTELVRRVYLEAINLKPMIKISAATIGQGGGITQTSQWPNSTAYSARFQDWRAWLEEGIIDINAPMFYYDAKGQWAHGWTNWITFAKNHKYNRHLAIGPAWYLNTVANSLTQIQQTRQPTSTGNRAEGVIGYNYATTNTGGVTRTNFLNALASGPFSGKAPIPPMPWKTNPTRGHAMGIVTANDTDAPFDHATITFNGPENRTVYSDGNGFYGAVDLIPGTYTVTASMPTSAYDPATAEITVTAGSVSEADLVLEFAPAAEIIVDDTDAEFAGSWSLGTNPSHYGSGYRTSYPANAATATFRPMISIPGTYEIFVWYVSGSNRSA